MVDVQASLPQYADLPDGNFEPVHQTAWEAAIAWGSDAGASPSLVTVDNISHQTTKDLAEHSYQAEVGSGDLPTSGAQHVQRETLEQLNGPFPPLEELGRAKDEAASSGLPRSSTAMPAASCYVKDLLLICSCYLFLGVNASVGYPFFLAGTPESVGLAAWCNQ